MNKAIWIVAAIATVIAVGTLVFLYGRMPAVAGNGRHCGASAVSARTTSR